MDSREIFPLEDRLAFKNAEDSLTLYNYCEKFFSALQAAEKEIVVLTNAINTYEDLNNAQIDDWDDNEDLPESWRLN